jgi:hypothetical protein
VSSSTLGTVLHVHVDTPSHSESLGGRSLLKLRRDSARMHRLSAIGGKRPRTFKF